MSGDGSLVTTGATNSWTDSPALGGTGAAIMVLCVMATSFPVSASTGRSRLYPSVRQWVDRADTLRW
ncbi:hypothetical protein EB75_15290 [Mycobacterium sp. ST-F2]|nr:hypothetical protein EB75_15290 [Mycobacterium sp. ST-F2]